MTGRVPNHFFRITDQSIFKPATEPIVALNFDTHSVPQRAENPGNTAFFIASARNAKSSSDGSTLVIPAGLPKGQGPEVLQSMPIVFSSALSSHISSSSLASSALIIIRSSSTKPSHQVLLAAVTPAPQLIGNVYRKFAPSCHLAEYPPKVPVADPAVPLQRTG